MTIHYPLNKVCFYYGFKPKEERIFRLFFFFFTFELGKQHYGVNVITKGEQRSIFSFPNLSSAVRMNSTTCHCDGTPRYQVYRPWKILRAIVLPTPKCLKGTASLFLHSVLWTKPVSINTHLFMTYAFLEHFESTQTCIKFWKRWRGSRQRGS